MNHHMIEDAVATLGTEDDTGKSTTTTQLPTEEEINEWTRKSRKERICGIVGCFDKPTTL